MVLNYMDYQIRQNESSRTAAVYRNGREILSLRLDDVLSAEKLVESAGRAMRMAGLTDDADRRGYRTPMRFSRRGGHDPQ